MPAKEQSYEHSHLTQIKSHLSQPTTPRYVLQPLPYNTNDMSFRPAHYPKELSTDPPHLAGHYLARMIINIDPRMNVPHHY